MTPIYDQLLTERYARDRVQDSDLATLWLELDNNTRPAIKWPERERQPHQFAPPYAQWEAERD